MGKVSFEQAKEAFVDAVYELSDLLTSQDPEVQELTWIVTSSNNIPPQEEMVLKLLLRKTIILRELANAHRAGQNGDSKRVTQ